MRSRRCWPGSWCAQLCRALAYACFEATALLYATELGLRRQRGRLVGLYYSASGMGGIAGSAAGGAAAQVVGMTRMFLGVVAADAGDGRGGGENHALAARVADGGGKAQ